MWFRDCSHGSQVEQILACRIIAVSTLPRSCLFFCSLYSFTVFDCRIWCIIWGLWNVWGPLFRRDNCSAESFEAFVKKALTQVATGNDCHFLPQVYYVFENGDHRNGKQVSRHILKLHNLSAEFPALMARYGHENVQLGHQRKHPGRVCHVKPTESTERMVREFYAADYEAFHFWQTNARQLWSKCGWFPEKVGGLSSDETKVN